MLNNIQFLRAFAALNVVLGHSIVASLDYNIAVPFFDVLQYWGACGVDIFFVISGFVMIYTQWQRPRDAWNFFRNRLERIIPLYWILTGILLAISVLGLVDDAFGGSRIAASFLFLSAPLLRELPVLYLGWTLEYEMAFYAIFAFSIFIERKIWQLLFVAVMIAGMVSVMPYSGIAFEFLFGMLLGALYVSNISLRYPLVVGLVGVALLASSIGGDINHEWRVLIWGFPALLIVASALYLPQLKGGLATMLGDASYSIYLVQAFTIPVAYRVFSAVGTPLPGGIMLLVAIASTAAAGVVCHFVIERPVARWLKSRKPDCYKKGAIADNRV